MSAKYAFIDAEKDTQNTDGGPRYQIKQMCQWLEVSRSGYYEWARRPLSATARWRAELGDLIEALHKANDTAGWIRAQWGGAFRE